MKDTYTSNEVDILVHLTSAKSIDYLIRHNLHRMMWDLRQAQRAGSPDATELAEMHKDLSDMLDGLEDMWGKLHEMAVNMCKEGEE